MPCASRHDGRNRYTIALLWDYIEGERHADVFCLMIYSSGGDSARAGPGQSQDPGASRVSHTCSRCPQTGTIFCCLSQATRTKVVRNQYPYQFLKSQMMALPALSQLGLQALTFCPFLFLKICLIFFC